MLRNLSFRRKLLVLVTTNTVVALLLASTVIVFLQYQEMRKAIVRTVSIQASLTAANCLAPISFNDKDAAVEALVSLSAEPYIDGAAIYTTEGEIFATYTGAQLNRAFPSKASPPGHEFEGGYLSLRERIRLQGEEIGTILIFYNLNMLSDQLGRALAIMALAMFLSMLAVFVLLARIQRLVSRPVVSLAETARQVSESRDYSMRAQKYSNDELGQLTDAFNTMLSQIQDRDAALEEARGALEQRVRERTLELTRANTQLKDEISGRQRAQAEQQRLQQELIEISRRAGMAEIATGVLHNVGNILNSVNVSASIIGDRVRHSRILGLVRVTEKLRASGGDLRAFLAQDERGVHLGPYLIQLADYVVTEREELEAECELLKTRIEHIKEIVATQQSFARVSGVREPINLAQLSRDALQIYQASFDRHGVELKREFEEVPPLMTEKQKILQIMINLISNARKALMERPPGHRHLTLRIRAVDEDHVGFEIEDTGVGIDPDDLTRIFQHGFTTRKDGHGFGLHYSAIAARELAGSLKVHSEGIGKGATFTLVLPYAAKTEGAAA